MVLVPGPPAPDPGASVRSFTPLEVAADVTDALVVVAAAAAAAAGVTVAVGVAVADFS